MLAYAPRRPHLGVTIDRSHVTTAVQLPFTTEQFFDAFRAYNVAVWPAQIILIALGIAAIVLLFVPRTWCGMVISIVLAILWAWVGPAYHLAFFAPINRLAYVFAAVSLAGAALFVWHGVVRRRLVFKWSWSFRPVFGAALLLMALVVYPVWSTLSGHRYPALPTFGLPCPTTIFTLGILGFLTDPFPRAPVVVPVLWCFIGTQAAFLLDVHPDLALIPAGLLGVILLGASRRPHHRE